MRPHVLLEADGQLAWTEMVPLGDADTGIMAPIGISRLVWVTQVEHNADRGRRPKL
jgi:hypothetical protein